jgi:2-polyprenyl-6-methoxyphenol hydroxylase-like FAD-dependent oxidoreductase
MSQDKPIYHIIGGGPVGFATALLLAKEGYQSIVYESRPEIPTNEEESYPICVNPRSFKTFDIID